MRKYISILILLASAAVHTACNESTVTMDDSVDVRVDSAMKGYQAQLAGAEFGWFADIETSKGFYRFWMDFADNNMVTMFTDNLDYPELNGIPRTSTYMFHAYQRPVLTFDTYNYLHIISDPNDAISGGTGNLGLKTDFEFEIDEVTDDVFTMTGRINRIKATLTRATEAEMQAVKQGQLQEALRNAPSYKQNLFCYMDVNGLTVDVKLSTRTVMFLYKVGNVTQIEAVETHTDIVTKDLVFDTPVTINGVEIKGLNYHADTDNFTTDSDTPILIQAKSKANIGMEACFGVEKYYTILRVEDGMFPSTNESENYLGYLMHNIFQMKLLLTSGIASFSHINLYFGLDTEGQLAADGRSGDRRHRAGGAVYLPDHLQPGGRQLHHRRFDALDGQQCRKFQRRQYLQPDRVPQKQDLQDRMDERSIRRLYDGAAACHEQQPDGCHLRGAHTGVTGSSFNENGRTNVLPFSFRPVPKGRSRPTPAWRDTAPHPAGFRIFRRANPAPAPPPIVRRSPQQQTLPTSETPFSGSDKFYPQKICINRKNTLHLHSQ